MSDEGHSPGIVHYLYERCTDVELSTCNFWECVKRKNDLDRIVPVCKTWGAFRDWVIQLASCITDNKQPVICTFLKAVVQDYIKLRPEGKHLTEMDDACQAWDASINIHEVLSVFTWLWDRGHDTYIMFCPEMDLGSLARESSWSIQEAMGRIQTLGLCRHRMYALAMATGGLGNLSALFPRDIGQHDPDRYKYNESHVNCSVNDCEESIKDFTDVIQLHKCGNQMCREVTFNETVLVQALGVRHARGAQLGGEGGERPTAWSVDASSIVAKGQPYMAISHLWADGTGSGNGKAGTSNECLWNYFCVKARSLGCKGIWWDTISVPKEKGLRARVLTKMHENYKEAKVTLVHDLYLTNFEYTDPASACFAIMMSGWFERGWTALELAMSKKVKFIFKNETIKDLVDDILSNRKELSSCEMIFRSIIQDLTSGVRRGHVTLGTFLNALGPRYCSWPADKLVITAIMTNVDISQQGSQQELSKAIIRKSQFITTTQLLHGEVTMADPGWSWCPTDIFKIPVGLAVYGPNHSIMPDGDVVGEWGTALCMGPNITLSIQHLPSLVQVNIQSALATHKEQILFLARDRQSHRQGLLVKVMQRRERSAINEMERWQYDHILVQYLGAVNARVQNEAWLDTTTNVKIKIANVARLEDLPRSLSACQYLVIVKMGSTNQDIRCPCGRIYNGQGYSYDQKNRRVIGGGIGWGMGPGMVHQYSASPHVV